MSERRLPDPGLGVYGISVAADLVGMAPQTLRLYEDRGLLDPAPPAAPAGTARTTWTEYAGSQSFSVRG